MKWNPEDEIEFIVRKLNHELTTAEERQFQCWLAEDQAHRSLFQEIESISLRSKEAKIVFEPDIELALQKVKSRRARMERLRHRIWQYAALILVALGLGIYGTYRFADRLDEVTDGVDAGSSRAILHLASGEKIVLGEEMAETYLKRTEVNDIWLDSNRVLRYRAKEKAIEGVRENRLEVPVGGEYRLTLSDGTRVWLNAASSLTYPEIFQDRERVVELTGEAFFEVKPDTALPFIVKTQGMRVKVLGTTFNVKAYPDELKLYTTLVEGKVEVFSDYLHRGVMLYPGEQAVSDSSEIQKRQVNVQPYISWKEGKFVFINAPLGEICKQIARWYDVEIQFADNEIGKVCFTGAILKFRPLEDLLDMIEVTSREQYRREGKILLFWQNK